MDKKPILIPVGRLDRMILLVQGQRVLLDRDLAKLYGVETRVLNQAVRRNHERFPDDFMFELDDRESENLRSQFGTSSWGWYSLCSNGLYRTGCSNVV